MTRIASLTFCLVTATILAGQSTQPASQTSGTPTQPSRQVFTLEQAISCSVAEAWELGGKTEEGFLEILTALASLSAQKRGALRFLRLRRLEHGLARRSERWPKQIRISCYTSSWTRLFSGSGSGRQPSRVQVETR